MPDSTLPEPHPLPRLRRARALRRAYLAGMIALVVLGLAGVAGDRTATTTAAGGGLALRVEYPERSRAGMPADLRVAVRSSGGFDGRVTLGVRTAYLDLLDDFGWTPSPSSSTGDGRWVRLTFEPPPGDELQVLLKARIDPSAHWGRDGAVAVLDGAPGGGDPVVEVEFRTVVMP